MQFTRKLITPVIATVLLIGGAAFAQDAVMDTIVESDGTWQDAGLFHWRYDAETGEVEWGDIDCTTPTTEVTADSELEHFGSNCHTIDLTEPRNPNANDDPDESDSEDASDTEVTHGDLVSRVAHDVKDADENGELEGTNRGSIISQIARGTKDLFGGDDEAEEPEDKEVEEPEAGDGPEDESEDGEPPDHANNDKDKAPPEKAKGKNGRPADQRYVVLTQPFECSPSVRTRGLPGEVVRVVAVEILLIQVRQKRSSTRLAAHGKSSLIATDAA